MSARLPNVRRAIFALLGTFVPFASSLLSGCGTTSAPTNDVPGDAAVHFVTVVTAGGGGGKTVPKAGPGASGSAGGSGSDDTSGSGDSDESGTVSNSGDSDESGTLFGSTGSSSGSGTASGSSGSSVFGSGSSSGSGSQPDGGTDGGGPTVAPDGSSPPGVCDDYTVTPCGTAPCDLRSNTCCVSETTFATRCLPGQNAACSSKEATLHCSNGCECSGDQVCCGISNTIAGSIESLCQSVPNGGQCSPYPPTSTQASAQFCKADSQCKNGQGCIHQTCTYEGVSGTFNICGVQYGCKAD